MSLSSDDSQSILEGNFDSILDELIISHQCHLCHQHFLAKNDFICHLRIHGQQEMFKCPLCDQLCHGRSTKLWRHMSKAHFKTRTEGFSCSLCEFKSFKLAFNFHLHMLIHLEEQPEKCRFCAKAFRTKPSLRKHELIHTGLKQFQCQECSSRFKTKDELKQHSISHTTGKPFCCHFCSKKFKYQASLKRHTKKDRCKPSKQMLIKQANEAAETSLDDGEDKLFFDDFLGNIDWEPNHDSSPIFSFQQ